MRYVIITGGELFNKGAQSMTFVTVDEIKKRFPDKEIILFSNRDFNRSLEEKMQYTFNIKMPYDLKTAFYLYGGFYKLIAQVRGINKDRIKEIKNILEKTDIMIDVSGYALGSNWNFTRNLNYIIRIKTAMHFGIKTYLMPQSFGPFEYKGLKGLLIKCLISKYLKYPKIIYAREKEGHSLLTQKLNLNNVKLSNDLVLSNKGIEINNIYKKKPYIKEVEINSKTSNVAIIPNMRNFGFGNKTKIIELYEKIVARLIEKQKNIYLLRHAEEDLEVCRLIKNKFKNNENVILLEDDFSCIEYDRIVCQFDFLIASRYHSIIHAYKNGVPCLALGWATKYHELLGAFNQHRYIFDVRQGIDFDLVLQSVEALDGNSYNESKTIKNILTEMQKINMFDVLGGFK